MAVYSIRRGVLFTVIIILAGAFGALSALSQTEPIPSGERGIRVRSTQVVRFPNTPFELPIMMDSQGDEAAASFTLNWDPVRFQFIDAVPGSDVPPGTNLSLNTSQVSLGRLGVLVDSPTAFIAGERNMMKLRLNTTSTIVTQTFPVTFSSSPTPQSVSNTQGSLVSAAYVSGSIVVVSDINTMISGRVLTPEGLGLRNAVVRLMAGGTVVKTATTSSFGTYSFENVAGVYPYTITVVSKRYRFASRAFWNNQDFTDIDLVAMQ